MSQSLIDRSNRTRLATYFGDRTSLLIDLQLGRNQKDRSQCDGSFPATQAAPAIPWECRQKPNDDARLASPKRQVTASSWRVVNKSG